MCSALTNVTIPASVTNIGGGAFGDCFALTTVTIPEGVVNISGAFGGSGLTNIIIPDSVTNIDGAFYDCSDLVGLTFSSNITEIGEYTFNYCVSLRRIVIPPNVTSIAGDTLVDGVLSGGSFLGCTNLTELILPASITNIEPYTFEGTALTNLSILGNPNIGEFAFSQLPLTSIYIPGGVIGDSAFWLCQNLTNLILGNAVTSIGSSAFYGDPIGSLVVPASDTYIGEFAFASSGLTNVVLPSGTWTLGGYAFGWTPLTGVTLLGNITITDDQVFFQCPNLTNVIIGAGVSNLSYGMFCDCPNLTSVLFMGNAPGLIGSWPSDGPPFWYDPNVTIYYLPGTTGWGNSYQGVAAVMWNPVIQTGWPSFGVSNGQFGFNITSKANIPIVVAASTNLGSGPWVPLLSCTLTNIDDAPPLYFSDPFWSNYPSRFYRIAFPGQYPTITESPSVIITNAGFGIGNNQFGFTITGPANISVTVQATTNLPGGSWTNLQSFTLTNGSIYFTDPGWTNYPGRFYRMAYPSFP
jgi:hypothetical protein